MQPMTEASGHIGDDAALRALAARDGYLLVRNLLPRDTVLAVAEQLGAIMADAGWIESDLPLAHAHANLDKRCVEPQPAFMDVFYRQLSLRALHALKAHTQLLDTAEAFLGGAHSGAWHRLTGRREDDARNRPKTRQVDSAHIEIAAEIDDCLLYTSPSPRD